MKIQTVILTLIVSLTACPLPIDAPMGDEASDDTDTTDETDTTEDTSEVESSESGTIDFPESTDESTDSTDEFAEESDDTMDDPLDLPMEEWGCCVCSADGFGPICLPPQSATGVACGELGEWAGMHATWVPCVTTPEGVVCELDCGS